MSLARRASIYIHYPFCAQICSFCAFNKYRRPRDLDDDALSHVYIRELDHVLQQQHAGIKLDVRSIYFGGGTPSLAPTLVERILSHVRTLGHTLDSAEVTIEANPTSLPDVRYLRDLGVTRVSLGVQSLVNDTQLRAFNREHSSRGSLIALERLVKDRRFLRDGFSFDLMFGNPLKQEQTDIERGTRVMDELQVAMPFARAGGHLSLYELTLEHGTGLAKDVKAGLVRMPESDQTADEYEDAVRIMTDQGFDHYEVSSFAFPGHYGRHNFAFWMHEDLIGIGPGAHGRITGPDGQKYRTRCIPDPKRWAAQVSALGHGRARTDALADSFAEECIALGLRTSTGISKSQFRQATGRELQSFLDMDQVKILEAQGYIEERAEGLDNLSVPCEYLKSFREGSFRATGKGRRLLDLTTPMLLKTA